jgi:hypothetical protein
MEGEKTWINILSFSCPSNNLFRRAQAMTNVDDHLHLMPTPAHKAAA